MKWTEIPMRMKLGWMKMNNLLKYLLKVVLVFAAAMAGSLLLLTIFCALLKLQLASIWVSALRVSALMTLIVIFEWVQTARRKKKEAKEAENQDQ